jgi:hypothetical protein
MRTALSRNPDMTDQRCAVLSAEFSEAPGIALAAAEIGREVPAARCDFLDFPSERRAPEGRTERCRDGGD